ncbi:MAG: alpha/beta hydrolase [Candidatus Saccharibacteria bacterium]|nr:alpha/beta hydrolase [Candidatus Saccharibacteria bacterium]
MKQIVLIHGGDSFASYDAYLANLRAKELDYARLLPKKRWIDAVIRDLPEADILLPSMPNSSNAQFDEWVIMFEKLLLLLGDDVRLIGHSLGAMFLVKYLQQHPLAKPVRQLHLVAGGYNAVGHDYGSFMLTTTQGVPHSADEVHLYHSEDDFVVPFEELAKLAADMPAAIVHRFTDRNHFLDPEFPELIDLLKQK